MAFRWQDFKERANDLTNEFKRQKVGMVGLGIIVFLLIIGIFAPVIAPGIIGHWEDVDQWRDNPRGSPPIWWDYFTSDDLAPHHLQVEPDNIEEATAGRFEEVTVSYIYDYQYDEPPKNLALYLDGSYYNESDARILQVEIIRPDDEAISLIDRNVDGGTFDTERFSLIGRNRETIYNWADSLGVVEEDISPERVNHARTLFGQADENLLSSRPTPLKGEYEIRIMMVSEDIEFNFGEDSGRLLFLGATYGWMGTDNAGRDIAAGWVWGARYALLLGAIIAGTTISIGTLYGMTSAYLGGWKDEFMQRINEIVIGIPILPILIIMMFIWRQSFWVMVALMSVLYWRGIAKTIRARGLQIRQSTFVEAAQSLGAGTGRVITTHMIPQILPYSMAEGALLVPIVVITEASLSVLGLGDPRLVTWGKLLSQAQAGQATVQGLWWWVLLPGIGITLLGFGFIATGMAIERIVNPKMRQR